jgi:hypothetical protein
VGRSAAGDGRSWHRSLPSVRFSLRTLTRPVYEPNTVDEPGKPVVNLAKE